MIDMPIPLLFAVFATFLIAGIVKGVTGMGLPTVAMGILGGLLSPLAAATLLIIPSFVTNFWQLLAGPKILGPMRRLWAMMLGVFAGTLAGVSMLTGGDTRLSGILLGASLTAYALYALFAKSYNISPKHERWLSPAIGVLTGLISGATGVFVIPAVPYIQALGLEKDDLVQALGLSFTVSTVALAIALGSHGAFQADGLSLSALSVIPALAGMWVGQIIRQSVSPTVFKRCFLIALAMLGAEMMLRALW